MLRRHGEIHFAQGNLEEAQAYLESALDACLPVKIQSVITQRFRVLLALGKLAEKQSKMELAEEHYRLAFEELLGTAREFSWNTLLKSSLANDIEATGKQLVELLDGQGNDTEADEVRATLERVPRAEVFALNSAPLSDEAAEQALRDYRNTTTYLSTLRFDLYWQWGVGMKDIDAKMKAIHQEKNLNPKYRKEFDRQLKSMRVEIEEKIARLEAEAQEYLVVLRKLDPETAAIIEM